MDRAWLPQHAKIYGQKVNLSLFYIGIDSVKIHIILLPSNTKKTIDVKKNTSVTEILEKLQIKPDTVIVTKNNIPIPIDEKLDEAKELKIIQVASGG